MSKKIEATLLALQADDDAIRMKETARLESFVDELTRVSPDDLVERFLEWSPRVPDALNLLLHAAAYEASLDA